MVGEHTAVGGYMVFGSIMGSYNYVILCNTMPCITMPYRNSVPIVPARTSTSGATTRYPDIMLVPYKRGVNGPRGKKMVTDESANNRY